MRESVTYMAIVEEGRAEEAKKLLILLGRKRFGPPSETTIAALEELTDLDRLEHLSERLLEVSSWEALLATPRRRRRSNGRKKMS